MSVEKVIEAAKQGVLFAIDSDAHKPQDVGNFERALKTANAAGLSAYRL